MSIRGKVTNYAILPPLVDVVRGYASEHSLNNLINTAKKARHFSGLDLWKGIVPNDRFELNLGKFYPKTSYILNNFTTFA